jgi:Holliday junction resolvasome RuvABC endonuclease subunit
MKSTKEYSVKVFGNPEQVSNQYPIFAGIDASYSGFGVTLIDHESSHVTYVAKFNGTGVERLRNAQKFLTDLFICENEDLYEFQDIAIEGYAFGSQMSNMLGELGGIVRLFIYEKFGIKPLLVPPTSLKKYVTGKGTGVQKNQMLLYVYKKWDVEFKDDNAADAYSLAKLVSGQGSLAYEKEIYSKLNDEKHRA